MGRAKVKKLKQREGIRTVYGKHTTLYLRFERMKRRRGKHTTCIIDVELLLFFSFFFGALQLWLSFRLLGMVSAYVSLVCVAGELKLKCVFIFYYFFLWSNGNLTPWYVYTTRFLPTMFLATFLVIWVSPNENWDRVWVLHLYMDSGLSLYGIC